MEGTSGNSRHGVGRQRNKLGGDGGLQGRNNEAQYCENGKMLGPQDSVIKCVCGGLNEGEKCC